jgi:CRISPR/Cas system endoribonuclease Cas6 (RAMP superfamily)
MANIKKFLFVVLLCLQAAVAQSPTVQAPAPHPIDLQRSVLTVRAFNSGLFSGFAHDHEINAPITAGFIDELPPGKVDFKVEVRLMKVLDPKLDADKRAEVQKTMLGESVLDSEHYPEIHFTSTQVRGAGENRWTVTGNLSLHGVTQPVSAEVVRNKDHYTGSATVSQRQFSIKPISIAGGTIKVKDEIKIEFDFVTK